MHQDPEVRVKKVRFDRVTASESEAIVTAFAKQRIQPRYVCTADLAAIDLAGRDEDLARTYDQADLVLAGASPVVWLSHLVGRSIPERISGRMLVNQVARISMRTNCRVFLLGGNAGSAVRTSSRMQRACPGANIVGCYSPSEELFNSPGEQMRIRAVVRSSFPDILLVAFKFPLQEKWIRTNLLELNVPVSIGVGRGFEELHPSEEIRTLIRSGPKFASLVVSMSYDLLVESFERS